MAEYEFASKIVELVSDHWNIFKYVFMALAFKYIGEGLFQVSKASALISMAIKKVFFNKD